jgi:hypothetical protein
MLASEQAWEPIASSTVNICQKPRTAPIIRHFSTTATATTAAGIGIGIVVDIYITITTAYNPLPPAI